MKTSKQLERYFKGAGNHYRISILLLLQKAEGMTLDGIAGDLNGNIKTISGHTQKLVQAGLLNKKYQGQQVIHTLSPYGNKFVKFIQSFQ